MSGAEAGEGGGLMPLPVLAARDLIKALSDLGYEVVRQRGSHASLRAPGRPPLTIPMHDPIAPGTLRAILRSAGITPNELQRLIHR